MRDPALVRSLTVLEEGSRLVAGFERRLQKVSPAPRGFDDDERQRVLEVIAKADGALGRSARPCCWAIRV